MSTPPRLSLVPPSRPAKALHAHDVGATPALALVPPPDPSLALEAGREAMAEALAGLAEMVGSGEVAGLGIVTIFEGGGCTWEAVCAVAHTSDFLGGLRALESEYSRSQP